MNTCLQGLCEMLSRGGRRLRSSLLGWVKTCRDRWMLPQTGKATCTVFSGGGVDPALGLGVLHGLHLSWAQDLGDAFTAVGSWLVLAGIPSKQR